MIVLFFLFSLSSFAGVWESKNRWSDQWAELYRHWVASANVSRDIFTSRDNSIVGRLSTDCADALYAIRIYFCYKNHLPFKMYAPEEYAKQTGEEYLSSETTYFDHIENQDKRVRAFIQYVLRESGTLNLVKDTYPLAVKAISSGDIYVTEWSLLGESFRHSYMIKSIDRDSGNGIFYWSDAPAKIRRLNVTKKYPDFVFSSSPWGYRRWKTPRQLDLNEEDLSVESGYSQEQYQLLRRYGKNRVLLEIRKRMRR